MIEFKNITKKYPDGTVAVDNLNIEFEEGEFIVFIGTSGSGKTTSMRMLNRMTEPSSGEILINGKNIMDMDPVDLRRKIGYVIQQIGLMPHMTVYENIVMVPRLLKWSEEKMRETALRLIKIADMPESFLDRYPSELSGGQQQRIGVIRALAANQKIVLMDEPFGALDPITRDTLQDLIKDIQDEFKTTIVFVTHDMDEALDLADKIAIMDEGKIIQFDTPKNILRNPANQFVEEFIGEERLLDTNPHIERVQQIMYKEPIYAYLDTNVKDAIRIMKENRVDTLFVNDEEKRLKGYVDIESIQRNRKSGLNIGDFMKTNLFKVKEDAYIRDCMERILKRNYKNVPVVNNEGVFVGLVTRSSLVDILYDSIWSGEESYISVNPEVMESLNEDINTEPVSFTDTKVSRGDN
ncbi:MAG: betaine/proline/choline family ABC transporter ATP-binding protein [Andreesenia angusta]|nr:betaine/proline/choline family ABC transporter ATP-binding protein [Andreesenia angusta]